MATAMPPARQRALGALASGIATAELHHPPGHDLVENLWARLKEWRAVATRYEKTARSFLGILCLAAAADWLKL